MKTILDTHAHLDHVQDLETALGAAASSGVAGILAVSEDWDSCRKNLEIKGRTKSPKIFPAFGIHPGNIKPEEVDACCEWIEENIGEAVAIGEIGLDFWYKGVRKDKEKKDEQRAVFRRFLDLAASRGLPAIIHTRGTWGQALEMTRDAGLKKAVFHWYSGPVDVLNEIIESGYYVSASPSLAYSPQSREAIAAAPMERTLIETDSPVPYRFEEDSEERRPSGPADVWHTLKALAELKGMDPDEALTVVNRNAVELFSLTL